MSWLIGLLLLAIGPLILILFLPTEEAVLRALASGAKTASAVSREIGNPLGAWLTLEELERQRLVTSYHSQGRRYWCLTRLGESDSRITGGRKDV
jgi:hypothetical protein